jgi:hypothetical protein
VVLRHRERLVADGMAFFLDIFLPSLAFCPFFALFKEGKTSFCLHLSVTCRAIHTRHERNRGDFCDVVVVVVVVVVVIDEKKKKKYS